jgi:hypothetical protein
MIKYPKLLDVVYLTGHDLLLRFDNGEDRICDMSQFFSAPSSKEYYSLPAFKQFTFSPFHIAWGGDYGYTIGTDSLYPTSFPYSQIVSSSIVSLSAARVNIPHSDHKYVSMSVFAHDERVCKHREPHIHVHYQNEDVPFTFDGNCLLPKSPFSSSVNKYIKKWFADNRTALIKEWNQANDSSIE